MTWNPGMDLLRGADMVSRFQDRQRHNERADAHEARQARAFERQEGELDQLERIRGAQEAQRRFMAQATDSKTGQVDMVKAANLAARSPGISGGFEALAQMKGPGVHFGGFAPHPNLPGGEAMVAILVDDDGNAFPATDGDGDDAEVLMIPSDLQEFLADLAQYSPEMFEVWRQGVQAQHQQGVQADLLGSMAGDMDREATGMTGQLDTMIRDLHQGVNYLRDQMIREIPTGGLSGRREMPPAQSDAPLVEQEISDPAVAPRAGRRRRGPAGPGSAREVAGLPEFRTEAVEGAPGGRRRRNDEPARPTGEATPPVEPATGPTFEQDQELFTRQQQAIQSLEQDIERFEQARGNLQQQTQQRGAIVEKIQDAVRVGALPFRDAMQLLSSMQPQQPEVAHWHDLGERRVGTDARGRPIAELAKDQMSDRETRQQRFNYWKSVAESQVRPELRAVMIAAFDIMEASGLFPGMEENAPALMERLDKLARSMARTGLAIRPKNWGKYKDVSEVQPRDIVHLAPALAMGYDDGHEFIKDFGKAVTLQAEEGGFDSATAMTNLAHLYQQMNRERSPTEARRELRRRIQESPEFAASLAAGRPGG